MNDRGDYSAIRVALINDPGFQRLAPAQRLVLLTLMATFNTAGIEVHYPDALAYQLAAQTGLQVDQIRTALEVLAHEDWIARDENVVWIRRQLADSNLARGNSKHRAAVRNMVAVLPRIGIVARFIRENEAWFSDEDRQADPVRWAFGSQSNAIPMASELEEKRREENISAPNGGAEESGGSGSAWPKSWAHDTTHRLALHDVVIATGVIGQHAKAVKGTVPWDEWLRVVDRMARSGACEYGFPAALRRLREFRDAAQPDPNRDLTLAEALAL